MPFRLSPGDGACLILKEYLREGGRNVVVCAMQDAKLSTNIYKKAELCPADDCECYLIIYSALQTFDVRN